MQHNGTWLFQIVLLLLLNAIVADGIYAQKKSVTVNDSTNLDWTFVLSNQSVVRPPAEWLPDDYESARQRYEISLPRGYSDKKSWPLILFISPSQQSSGIAQWEAACRGRGIIIASPLNAGNKVSTPQRIRIVLDVLADIHAKHNIDFDRTYIGGFSGGGRIACSIAFALPEFFGGVIPVCAGGELRQEPWLRQRVIDRLSVAQLTGATDFNRGEVERLRQTELSGVGVNCKTWVVPRLGHAVPNSKILLEAYDWLESDLQRRKDLADKWPASRASNDQTRQDNARALLAEAKIRIGKPETLYTGLMQLKGVQTRWNDLDQASDALKILTKVSQSEDDSWQAADIAEQKRFLIARARALDAYGSGDLPKQYATQRSSIINAAIRHWEAVLAATENDEDDEAAAEAKRRIPILKVQLNKKDN